MITAYNLYATDADGLLYLIDCCSVRYFASEQSALLAIRRSAREAAKNGKAGLKIGVTRIEDLVLE